MIGSRVIAWVLLAAWLTWFFAIQARLSSAAAPFVPELGLVLALSLLARLEQREAPLLALVLALTRSAFSSEPPVAVLAGCSGVVLATLAVRSVVELTGPLWRTLVAVLAVLLFDTWLGIVHGARAPEAASAAGSLGAGPFALLAVAISSGMLALLAGPALAHLPGLTPLRKRRW